MQKSIRKIYLSIVVVVLCLITLSATTFAWVGIFTSSTFDKFDIKLNNSELEEYGIEISLTGEEGTFSNSVDIIELKKQILINFGTNMNYINTPEAINYAFKNLNMHQCTVKPNEDKTFPDFLDVYNQPTRRYFRFDLYISANQLYDSGVVSNYILDVYLTGDLLQGAVDQKNLINKFTYPSDFVNNVPNGIQPNTVISRNVKMNSANACRVAIQKYNVVEKYKPELYDEGSYVLDNIIYHVGTEEPTIDPETGIYCFGGILPDKYNLATYDWNTKFKDKFKFVPDWALNRGDILFDNTKANKIIDSKKVEEQITVESMMKMTIYFWIEGWDADCIDIIDLDTITMSLNFSTKGE